MASLTMMSESDGGGGQDDGAGRQKCGRDEDWRCKEELSSPKAQTSLAFQAATPAQALAIHSRPLVRIHSFLDHNHDHSLFDTMAENRTMIYDGRRSDTVSLLQKHALRLESA